MFSGVGAVIKLCVCAVGYYFSGDGAHRTADGYYQITGRMDDIINISGHRLGTAEIEDALVRGGAIQLNDDHRFDWMLLTEGCSPVGRAPRCS